MNAGLRSRLIVGQRLFWEVKVASQIERNVKPKWDPNVASSPASSGASDEREVRGSGGEAMALRYGLLAEAYLHGTRSTSSTRVSRVSCAVCHVVSCVRWLTVR
jgi:hypothetical protein